MNFAAPVSDDARVSDALAAHYVERGFPPDGGASAATVTFPLGRWRVTLPNPTARQRALHLHDLQHLATGYHVDWYGEAEIAAWELASGCGAWIAPWVLATIAFSAGLVLAPRRVWRAFVRGRASRSLFAEEAPARILDGTVGELRAWMGLNRAVPAATARDFFLFALCCLPVLLLGALLLRLLLRFLLPVASLS